MSHKESLKVYYMIDRHGSTRKIMAKDDNDAWEEARKKDPLVKSVGHLRREDPVKSSLSVDASLPVDASLLFAFLYGKNKRR